MSRATTKGKKVYRHSYDGPTKAKATATTYTIILTSLTCYQTEDNSGPDEAELRIWSDNVYQTLRRDMDDGATWNLNVKLKFTNRIKIQLWDLDNPGFPLYDAHDLLGTVIIDSTNAKGGAGTFNQDGADYEIEWIKG